MRLRPARAMPRRGSGLLGHAEELRDFDGIGGWSRNPHASDASLRPCLRSIATGDDRDGKTCLGNRLPWLRFRTRDTPAAPVTATRAMPYACELRSFAQQGVSRRAFPGAVRFAQPSRTAVQNAHISHRRASRTRKRRVHGRCGDTSPCLARNTDLEDANRADSNKGAAQGLHAAGMPRRGGVRPGATRWQRSSRPRNPP